MGKSISKAFKSVTKAVKKVVKTVGKTASSFATAGVDAVKSAAKGDLGGLADSMTRAATDGTVSLGDKGGVLNAGLTNKPKEVTQVVQSQQDEADGLLNYVSDLRARKQRRSRASTNNTDGSSSGNGNKLSGTTTLGV